jgi:hypothetical protein
MLQLPGMAKMIQVRNVPARLHRELVRRARARGQTLTDYIQAILEREVERPLPEDVFARIRERRPVELGRPAAELIREERPGEDEL